MTKVPALVLALCGMVASPAFALNSLLSNDDGFSHPNIRALYSALKAVGHQVKIAAPQSEQSARGGAFLYGREVRSTPVMALLMGLKKVMPAPELVILGPNPGMLALAAVAERTRHIELGTAVTVLPVEDPVRLAEDASVLDQLSAGRVQLGLGSGGANLDSFSAFERDAGKRQQHFAEDQQQLQALLNGQALRTGSPLTLQPPAPGLAKRLWHSHGSVEGARYAASQGNGLLLGTATHDPLTVQKPLADAYLDAWNHPNSKPRIGVVRAVFPAADRATAQAELAVDIERHVPRLQREGLIDHTSDLQEHLRLLNVHHGHPDEVLHSLRNDPSLLPYADYLIVVVQAESSTQAQVLQRLQIIAQEIAPALGWQPRSTQSQATEG